MEIYNPKMISTIIDYLDLPLSKKATAIHYYNRNNVFIIYGDECDNNHESVQVNFSLNVRVNYWGNILLELFSNDRPESTLVLESDNFYVRSCLTFQGYLKYGNFYIASLD